jgi:FixJ family two-component response regulator
MVVATNEETGGEIFELHDVLSCDQEDPSTKAARKMDWETFMTGLSSKDQAIVTLLIEGKCGSAIARQLRVCASTIQDHKRSLAKSIVEFMGPDILIQVQRSPKWKSDLAAVKEKLACRHARTH